MIRTPDQRLRVFVSSTLAELGPERKAVKAAIERLRLIPVLFESGARPHAPRDIYRAYLEQSQIFIGIYGASYGWVAPDMDISGLEDELHLSGSRPRLIYVKNMDGARDPRLQNMLNELKSGDSLSYQKFGTPEELGEQVQNDLAVLLSERFGAQQGATGTGDQRSPLPALRGPSIGRDAELATLCDMVARDGTGLVTVTGPGGTGKSRMCLMVAHRMQARFGDGAVFVPLASIDDPALVAPAISGALGSYDNARRSSVDLLNDVLREKHMLLVLDNFEQVLPAATMLTDLLEHCPQLRILVSSRTPLHVRGEQVFPLSPLQEPADPDSRSPAELLTIPSVDLFVRRAREASASMVLDEPNVRAIAAICLKLDGLPLAIELAAAHTRMLQPVALEQRMAHALGMLTRGARDLPERQRTMRATIEWSHALLDGPARILFRRLAVMADRFRLTDAHAVAGGEGSEEDTLAALEQLVDQGLVRMFPAQERSEAQNLFALLHVVREFALEELDTSGDRDASERRHASHFSTLAADLERRMLQEESGQWIDRIEAVQADVRAAFWHWIHAGDRAAAWRLIADQRGYLAHAGRVSEAIQWMEAAGVFPDQGAPQISDREQGRTITSAGLALAISGRFALAADLLEKAVDLLDGEGEREELSRALSYLGLAQLSKGDPKAMVTLQRTVEVSERIGVDFDACLALSFLGEACIAAGDLAGAQATLDRARPIAERRRSGSAEALYRLQRGNLYLVQQRPADALASYEESVGIFDAVRMMPLSGWALWGIGYTSFKLGRMDRAREGFHACLDRARRTSDSAMVCGALLCFALLAEERGAPDEAQQLLTAAERIAASIDYAFWSTDRVQYEDVKQRLHASLTPERSAEAAARGKDLTQEAAIALALKVGGAAMDQSPIPPNSAFTPKKNPFRSADPDPGRSRSSTIR